MRVLIVEDVRRLADDVAEGLRDQGMAVDVSYDGLDAAAKIDLNPYDVVVLDRDLPGLHGDAICRLAAESEAPPMVLMLTAAAEPEARVSGLSQGADDYLAKPFHFPELVLRVWALARRRPGAATRVLRIAGIEFDLTARTVTRHGARIDLSAKELGLLEALMRAAPSPLTAEQLLREVWDENADPFTKTVQVTMGRLRRKLGEPQVIATRPGIGYVVGDRSVDVASDSPPSA